MKYSDIITMEPGKRGGKPCGKPCIRGLRTAVYDVLEYLASGMTHPADRGRGYLFPALVVLLFSIQVCASGQTAPNIRKIVVAAVDGKYLYRQSPAWRSARESILAIDIDNDDPRQAYAAVARQLSTLADPELHLVSPSELSAIDGES